MPQTPLGRVARVPLGQHRGWARPPASRLSGGSGGTIAAVPGSLHVAERYREWGHARATLWG